MKGFGLAVLVCSLVVESANVRGGNSPLGVFLPTTNQPPSGLQISAGWNPSPDTSVSGYYMCWGFSSGYCTNLIDVGNVTNATLDGLSTNVLYYFTVVAHDSSGQQAPPSNEIQYIGTNGPAATPPIIVADLTNQNAALGSSLVLAVSASGSDPKSYVWLFNGLPLQVPSSNTLTLPNLMASQGGQYQVIVTNSAGSVTSSVATVTVLLPPTITSDLVSQTVCAGSNATFQVGVSGTGPFNYQWLYDSTNVPGAAGDFITFNKVGSQQAGTYQVIVSNAVGVASSATATLTVLNPPMIVAGPTNQVVAPGSNVTFQVAATGSAPLRYQWLFNGAALPGATSDTLTLGNVDSATAGSYQVTVANAVGFASSGAAQLTILPANILRIDSIGTNQLRLTFTGSAGQNYSAQYSTDYSVSWNTLGSATADATGTVVFMVSKGGPFALYRVTATVPQGHLRPHAGL